MNPNCHPLFALRVLSNRDKHRRLNLFVPRVTIKFVNARRQPVFEGPAPCTRVTPTDGDTYTVTLTTTRRDADGGMYLLPAYDVRLDEPPDLLGNLIDTLAGINEFIDCRVFPAVTALLTGN